MQGSSTGNGRAVQRFPNTFASATDMSFQNRHGWCARSKGLSGLGAVTSFFLFLFFSGCETNAIQESTPGEKNGMNHRVFLNRKGCYKSPCSSEKTLRKSCCSFTTIDSKSIHWWQLMDPRGGLSREEILAMGNGSTCGNGEINEGRRSNPWLCWSKVWAIFSNLLDLLDILLTPAGFHLW